ncbi:hypothetical protein PV367_16685 [Streptomyces europaeiscabiei]|uniref:Uncharacterized protein n=1 Tax=Streptomyces europaeiscabiei TaxID=146819 RepID=A0AAJ2PPV7_9ACTN|nr:hypothetical protein [Streptomyces europaeiscabiei]MDX3131374.1 hypothetical protein [Streptomyces europaeiscabiei]
MQRYEMFIDGESRKPGAGEWFPTDHGAITAYLEDKSVWINTGAATGNPFVLR